MHEMYIPASAPDVKVPFTWGDIVLVNDGINEETLEMVYFPDNNFEESETYMFTLGRHPEFGFYQGAIRSWDQMKFVKSYADFDNEDVKEYAKLNRKGICINSAPWMTGVDLFFDLPEPVIDLLNGNRKAEELISAGSLDLVRKFWSSNIYAWRVLFHREDDWSTWSLFGIYNDEEKARKAFLEKSQEALNKPPKFIRHGIYKNNGEINCVTLYKGPYLMACHNLLIGQGEVLVNNGINEVIEEFEYPADAGKHNTLLNRIKGFFE